MKTASDMMRMLYNRSQLLGLSSTKNLGSSLLMNQSSMGISTGSKNDKYSMILNDTSKTSALSGLSNMFNPPVEKPQATATASIGDEKFVEHNQSYNRKYKDRNEYRKSDKTLIHDRVSRKDRLWALGGVMNPKKPKQPFESPNGNMAYAHAEVGAIEKAFRAGKTVDGHMTMDVAGEKVCKHCFYDLAFMAEAAGLKSLTVSELVTGKTLYWEPGMRSMRYSE